MDTETSQLLLFVAVLLVIWYASKSNVTHGAPVKKPIVPDSPPKPVTVLPPHPADKPQQAPVSTEASAAVLANASVTPDSVATPSSISAQSPQKVVSLITANAKYDSRSDPRNNVSMSMVPPMNAASVGIKSVPSTFKPKEQVPSAMPVRNRNYTVVPENGRPMPMPRTYSDRPSYSYLPVFEQQLYNSRFEASPSAYPVYQTLPNHSMTEATPPYLFTGSDIPVEENELPDESAFDPVYDFDNKLDVSTSCLLTPPTPGRMCNL